MSLQIFARPEDKDYLSALFNQRGIPSNQYNFHSFPSDVSTKNIEDAVSCIRDKIDDFEKDVLMISADFKDVNVLQLLLEIRMLRDSDLALMKVVICCMPSLFNYLKANASNVFFASPNTFVLDILDLKDIPDRLIRIMEEDGRLMSEEKQKEVVRYMTNVPIFDKNQSRHKLASQYGASLLFGFAERVEKASRKYKYYGFEEVVKRAKKIDNYGERYLDNYLRQCLFAYRKQVQNQAFNQKKFSKIASLIQNIHQNVKGSKIGLIDDETSKIVSNKSINFGWLHAFQKLLFEDKEAFLEDVVGKCGMDYLHLVDNDKTINEITKRIKEEDYACLLLDVKLTKPTEDEKPSVEDELGTKLLKSIREKFPTLPIIMITSSNKPWRHRTLIDYGAEAVWVKEGVDEQRSAELSDTNIIRLLMLIQNATGEEYQFMRRLGDAVKEFDNTSNVYWWHNTPLIWNKNVRTYDKKLKQLRKSDADSDDLKKEIPKLLNEGIVYLRSYLRQTKMEFDESDLFEETSKNDRYERMDINFLAKSIVVQLGKIIELIHGQKYQDDKGKDRINKSIIGAGKVYSLNKFEVVRGDWIGYFLYEFRNECAHYFENVKYAFLNQNNQSRSLSFFIAHLVAYLSSDVMSYHSDVRNESSRIKKDKKSLKFSYIANLAKRRIGNKFSQQDKKNVLSHIKIYNRIMNNT